MKAENFFLFALSLLLAFSICLNFAYKRKLERTNQYIEHLEKGSK